MRLFVFTLTGKTVTLNVDPSDAVSSVLENIRRVEMRTVAEEGALEQLMWGTTHSSPLRLVDRTSGFAVDDSMTIRDLLDSHGSTADAMMEVKVVVRKRLDNLNAGDFEIMGALTGMYDDMVKEKGPRATALDIVDQIERGPPPGCSCSIGPLRFNCQMALGSPSVLLQGIHYNGLVFEGFS